MTQFNKWPALAALGKDDRPHILVWLGPFFISPTTSNQRSIYGWVAPLPQHPGKSSRRIKPGKFPDSLGMVRIQQVEFGVGDLAMLHVGQIFRQQKPVRLRRSRLHQLTFTADFDQQAVIPIDQLHGLNAENTWLSGTWERLKDTPCIVLPSENATIVIPIPEMLRWCYGTSSRMLHAVLSQEIGPLIQQVQDSGTLHQGIYAMTMPEDFPETDAPLFAWLALDAKAREAAERVDLQVLARHRDNSSNPRATFPYTGQKQLSLQGRWVTKNLFLASLIQHVDFTPPFQAVALPRPQEPAPPTSTSPSPGSQLIERRKRQRQIKNPERYTLRSDIEPGPGRATARLPALPAQFSAHIPIIHLTETGGTQKAVVEYLSLHPPRTLTTNLGKDPDSQAGRAVLASPTKHESPVVNDTFLQLRLALDLLGQHLKVREIPVNNPLGSEGRFQRWFNPVTKERIGCLIAEIETPSTQFYYLLEKELVWETYGPLILATRGSSATEAELNSLMEARQRSRTWPKTVPGWTLIHIRHSYGSPEGLAVGLRKAMQLPGTPSRP